jgi:hypothetical protein
MGSGEETAGDEDATIELSPELGDSGMRFLLYTELDSRAARKYRAAGYNENHRGEEFMTSFSASQSLRRWIYQGLALSVIFVASVTVTALFANSQESGIPAYNAAPPPKGTKLPAILTKADLWGPDAQFPYQTHAYELAAKIPAVLHQQPCYCYCDRMGHNSLHSCFEGTHGAQCATCLKELYYSYQQHQKGKTATQIRAGIIKGEWKQIDLQSAAEIN